MAMASAIHWPVPPRPPLAGMDCTRASRLPHHCFHSAHHPRISACPCLADSADLQRQSGDGLRQNTRHSESAAQETGMFVSMRHMCGLLVLAAAFLVSCATPQHTAQRPRNIIIMFADGAASTQWDSAGIRARCCGNSRYARPTSCSARARRAPDDASARGVRDRLGRGGLGDVDGRKDDERRHRRRPRWQAGAHRRRRRRRRPASASASSPPPRSRTRRRRRSR